MATTIFALVSLALVAMKAAGVTIDTLSSTDWQPSGRSLRQPQQSFRSGSISVMRPPPRPHEKGPRGHSRPSHHSSSSLTTHNRHPSQKRPSTHSDSSSKQFLGYQDDIRPIRPNFAQSSPEFSRPTENIRQKPSFSSQIVDTSSRKPQKFNDLPDSFMSESIVSEDRVPFTERGPFQYPNRLSQFEQKQQQHTSILESSSQRQNRFVQNAIPIRSIWNQNGNDFSRPPPVEEDHGQHSIPVSSQSPHFSGPQLFPSAEAEQRPTYHSNTSGYLIEEPLVQFTQSIEASEHHSTYHAPGPLPQLDPAFSAIKVTKAPSFGPGTRSAFQDNQSKSTSPPETKKKATLKDILAEDCPKAKEMGYCASPPRYPSNQVSQLIERCSAIIPAIYAPIPDSEDDEDTGEATDRSFNSTRNMERGNRHVWSWAHPGEFQQTVCDSDRRKIEPGYVLEATSGRWYVVLQAPSITQRVTVDKCRSVGKPCAATKCARGNGFRNNAAKSSRCVQRFSYQHLVTWDPDKPELCPRIRVFRFPTACVCYLTSS
ncbi:uncharacterized protein [Periplaneta americana]|uniref:uncharacterized protein n=1 Tax=Periplaneta americana TaxID=6978 RepID=UPI0037E9C84A